jgi:hypothetical protein
VRLFTTDGTSLNELTDDAARQRSFIRVAAADLQQARRLRARSRSQSQELAVILDVAVAIAGDFRAAQQAVDGASAGTVHYTGTVAGLAGLIADIESAGVADGVTLIAAAPGLDLDAIGRDVLSRLAGRDQARAS